MEEKIKVLFPDNVEKIIISKDDYDRLYGEMTLENINLKQENEELKKIMQEVAEDLRNTKKYNHHFKYLENNEYVNVDINHLEYLIQALESIEHIDYSKELNGSE